MIREPIISPHDDMVLASLPDAKPIVTTSPVIIAIKAEQSRTFLTDNTLCARSAEPMPPFAHVVTHMITDDGVPRDRSVGLMATSFALALAPNALQMIATLPFVPAIKTERCKSARTMRHTLLIVHLKHGLS
jgi:hypothetical protein